MKAALTTTRGKKQMRHGKRLPNWTETSCLQKVCRMRCSRGGRNLTFCLGYKEFHTERRYMALMGDWRNNKDVEIPLDGIGGVNILVKADVHRSGNYTRPLDAQTRTLTKHHRHQFPLLPLREPSRDRRLRENGQTCGLRRLRSSQLRGLAHRYGRETRQRRVNA